VFPNNGLLFYVCWQLTLNGFSTVKEDHSILHHCLPYIPSHGFRRTKTWILLNINTTGITAVPP
jgi:hypothetical protein